MPFVILFIYFNYLVKNHYDVLGWDWLRLFAVGGLQLLSWFVRTGIESKRINE